MIRAVENQNFEIVQILIDLGADVKHDNYLPVRTAIFHDNKQIIKILVRAGSIEYLESLKV